MFNTKKTVLAMAALMATATGSVQADTVSYFINQTNSDNLSDGINYAQVTISDGAAGAIDFSVEVLAAGFTEAGATPETKLTMKTFAFNFTDGLTVGVDNIENFAPAHWEVNKKIGHNISEFGRFEFLLTPDKNNTATTTLSFSIVDVADDRIWDYAVGNTSTSDAYFATHISGYSIADSTESSAHFATVVPVPAAAWLFGSGLIGLVGIARRRAS